MSAAFGIGAAAARLTRRRPLLVVDADEVLLRFVDGFDAFLRTQELFLDLTTYRLHGNVRRIADATPVLDVEVTALLDSFRGELDSLALVDGAAEALTALKPRLDIVVLTNIAESQAPARRRNLLAHGLDLPIVANSGAKGAAVRDLAAHAGRPAFFVDDIPQHLASSAEAAPEIWRIHLIGDDRLKPLLPAATEAHLRAENWPQAQRFIEAKLTEAGL